MISRRYAISTRQTRDAMPSVSRAGCSPRIWSSSRRRVIGEPRAGDRGRRTSEPSARAELCRKRGEAASAGAAPRVIRDFYIRRSHLTAGKALAGRRSAVVRSACLLQGRSRYRLGVPLCSSAKYCRSSFRAELAVVMAGAQDIAKASKALHCRLHNLNEWSRAIREKRSLVWGRERART